MIPGVDNKHLQGVGLSSMWTEGLAEGTPREIRQSLLYLSRCAAVYRIFQNGMRRMVGLCDQIVEDLPVQFSPAAVVQIGADLQERMLVQAQTSEGGVYVLRRPSSYHLRTTGAVPVLNENNEIISNEMGETILTFVGPGDVVSFCLSATALYPRYVVPIPEGLRPTMLSVGDRDLVVGLDFVVGDGCIITHETPELLFPEHFFMIRSARTTTTAPLSFTWQLDGLTTPGVKVSRYLRESQSLYSFRLAILEVAGITMLPKAGILQAIKVHGDTTRYIFEDFVVAVPYAHTPLVIGAFYDQDYAISDGLQVFGPSGGSWWRELDWSEGLSLDGLTPFSGLVVPDQVVRFSWSAGEFFPISGDSAVRAKFWAHVRQSEEITGHPLTDVAPDGSCRNPIDFIFQFLLGSRAVIVRIDPDVLGGLNTKRVLDFIHREHPVGSVVITTAQPLAQL